MFDGKIDFMDFNKIKINYGGKLTCRKIFKKKYIIFLILSLIGLIVLISLYTVKNKNINSASNDIENYKKRQSEIENNYNEVKTRNDKEEIDLSQYRNQITSIKNDIEGVSRKEESIKKVNKQIKTERDELEKRSTSLSLEYKTQFELKGVYEQKISSLTTLLNSLKTEYEKLKEQKTDKDDNKLNIKFSKIVSLGEAFNIEKTVGGNIGDKCFDNVEDNFSAKIFHEKCDKYPTLLLIRTDDDKRIGAFIRVPQDGNEIKKDPNSCLINIDTNKYYYVASPEYSTIVCDPNELTQMGVDLKIKTDGKGINMFPLNYGKNTDSMRDFYGDKSFNIKNFEIYKVIFK